MVFINKLKDIIKLFEESSREEIGIALFAYEQFICKGLKVKNKDIERLTEIFEYYDDRLSDDYPSLTNEALQESDKLISDYFTDNFKIKNDSHIINFNLSGRYMDTSYFDVEIKDKSGYPICDLKLNIKDSQTNSNYDKDSFNTTYNACKEIYKQMKTKDIKSMIDTFKL